MKLLTCWLASVILPALLSQTALAQEDPNQFDLQDRVGRSPTGKVVTPVNQVLTPAGIQVELPLMRPQVLALSPDGKLLLTSGKSHDLVVVDPATGEIRQRLGLPGDGLEDTNAAVSTHILKPEKEDQVSFTGLVFSPDGSRIYLSNVKGSIKLFAVDADHKVTALGGFPLPESGAPRRKKEIPAGLAVSPDSRKLYVALNLGNRLAELDARTGAVLRTFDVGALPYDVVLAGHKAYVSNWGGRRPAPDSVTGPAGRGTTVRVDPVRFIASEGSVSVVDLAAGKVLSEIPVGLHASALALTPDGRHLFVANAGSDSVSVIDTRKDVVVETITLRWEPNDIFGCSPNALAVDAGGKTLYVGHGTQNAIGVVAFNPGKSKLIGLIPTGWFPGAIVLDPVRHQLDVANIKGSTAGKPIPPGEKIKHNSHQYFGTLSLIPVPQPAKLEQHTAAVFRNYRRAVAREVLLPARADRAPQPVPERTGEPSPIKHVVYIIKENRTYDQVLGDLKKGNGDASLCVFGEKESPNQHKMVREFTLLDNTYCSGILSADGHQWATTGFATDYMEKSFAGFPRSYPDGMDEDGVDAMAYSPAGFIWDNALAQGKTFRDYGEFTMQVTGWVNPAGKRKPKFLDFYHDFTQQTGLLQIGSVPAIESVRPYMMTNTVGWNLSVPDVFRAAQFIKELHQFEATGSLPQLSIICLPNDHTSGTSAGSPTPAAQVADNDLAFGQIVEAISHSAFWKDTCIFAIEDDPQAGWDHVSGYRTTAYVISPYTRRHAVVSVNYNQPGLLRTMELILGLPPMNQFDATATPWFECFTNQPDFTPFSAVPNNVPLDQMNPDPRALRDPIELRYAKASANLRLDQPDQCPEDVLNRIIWFAQKGRSAPYPNWAVQFKDSD